MTVHQGQILQHYQAQIAMTAVDELMTHEQERDANKPILSHSKLRGEIELRNVSFSYPGQENSALNDVSIRIRQGERVGILGRVGSGKSSLEKLILGLYKPTVGKIFIDGKHINQIDPGDLRRNIGYIPQDVQLLSGTVFDNITLGIDHPSDEKLKQAINVSGLAGLVGEQAEGLAMPVGEAGSKLSGGQRQTIAVARAIMPDSSILLFDEPTSAMDSALEAHVSRNLKQYSQGKTLLLVTHRTSLLDMVDRLIVMDGGRIVADGAKQDVLQALDKGTLRRAQ